MLQRFIKKAPFYSRYTFHFHLQAMILDGAFVGIFSLQDVVLRKTLGATDWQMTLVSTIYTCGLFFSIFWSHMMRGRRKAPFLLTAALFGRLALIAIALVASPGPFIFCIFMMTIGSSLIIPAISSIYQANYAATSRGRFFGYATSAFHLTTAVVTFAAGALLDYNENFYRLVFPIGAVCGFWSIARYARIRVRYHRDRKMARSESLINWQLLIEPIRDCYRVLKNDYQYRHYEINFILYGVGFIMLLPVVPIFLVDEIGAEYSQVATARTVIFSLLFIVLSPTFGKLLDRRTPFFVGGIFFPILALYPLTLYFSQSMALVYVAFIFFGIAMSGVNLIWNLGAIYFSGSRDSAQYMGVHVALTGLRGAVAPSLSYLIMSLTSLRTTFLVAAGFMLVAALRMWKMQLQTRTDPDCQPDSNPAPTT